MQYNVIKLAEPRNKSGITYVVTQRSIDYFLAEFNPELIKTMEIDSSKQACTLASNMIYMAEKNLPMMSPSAILNVITQA